jgi:hypothetical protein
MLLLTQMSESSSALFRLGSSWLDGKRPELAPQLPGEIPAPAVDGAIHLVYSAPATGAQEWLRRIAITKSRKNTSVVHLDSRLLALSDTYSMLESAAEFIGPGGVILVGEMSDAKWVGSLKQFRDTHPFGRSITFVVVLQGVGDRSEITGTLAGRRGPGATESLMLPQRYREFLQVGDAEVSAGVENSLHQASSLVDLARRLQPQAPQLRALWQQWCEEGSLPRSAEIASRLHVVQSAVESFDERNREDVLAVIEGIASDSATPLRRLGERVHRTERWLSLADKLAIEKMVWFSVARPNTVRAPRQRFLVDPSYAPIEVGGENAAAAGVIRSLWRMSLLNSPEYILNPRIELEIIAKRDAFRIGRVVIDVHYGSRLDGRSIRPLRALQERELIPIQASVPGVFSTRFEVPVIPSWIIALAADFDAQLLERSSSKLR